MSKDMLIDSEHPEEIRVAVVSDGKLDKFDFAIRAKVQLRGNVYLAKVVRVEPSLQAAFVDYGGNRHGFLGFSDIHHDYFQIPIDDRQELETHLQNAIAAHVAETGQSEEELDSKEISKLRYQFYKRYKIQEVIKKGQIMLVQVAKEERGNKGAALTTYISLPGRYCVFMPNTSKSSGVSRKITNRSDRVKLKKIVSDLHTEKGSVVIRTAGIGHTRSEITKDFAYLQDIWNEIREVTLKSIAPCLIHEEASIIKRAIRDMYSKDVSSVVVAGEDEYKTAKSFMKRLMPSHAKKVKLYDDNSVSLFSKYKLNEQINQIYSTRVDLPSGGYLVINNTEALVAIDVNSGKSTRERNISGTALKTNLEAAVEIARQCRLRDLGGLVVVDFIDMTDKRNNAQVERCMRDALKNDKAKVQVGTISHLGLLEFSRQRLRASIADANMMICQHCRGTGFMWSEESLALQLLRRIEEACDTSEFKEVNVTSSGNIVAYLLNHKRQFISSIETRGNLKISFSIDNRLADSDFKIDQVFRSAVTDDVYDANDENEIAKVKPEDSQETHDGDASFSKSRTPDESSEDTDTRSGRRGFGFRERATKKNRFLRDAAESAEEESSVKNVQATKRVGGARASTRKRALGEEGKSATDSTNKKLPFSDSESKVRTSDLSDEMPRIGKGKIDVDAKIPLDMEKINIASQLIQSYQEKEMEKVDVPSKKKRGGWWQKLLKKPEN